MPFDIGAGLSKMGEDVGRVAGAGALEAQKSAAENEKIKLANELAEGTATRGREQQAGIDLTKLGKEQEFTGGQNDKNRATQLEGHRIAAGATTQSAETAAGASRFHTEAEERMGTAKNTTAENVAHIQGSTRLEVASENRKAMLEKFGLSKLAPGPALDNAAQNWIDTGKMGTYGRSSGVVQVQIQERAAEMMKEKGLTLDQIRGQWGTREAAQKDYANQMKMGSQIKNFSETLDKNIKGLDDLMDGFGPSASPIVNRWVQAGRQHVLGDKEVTALNYQLGLIAIEAAKLNTGQLGIAGLPEGAREKSQAILNEMKNPETIARVIDAIRADAANRLSTQGDQIEYARKAIESGKYTPLDRRNDSPATTPNQARDNPKGYPEVPRAEGGGMDRAWLAKQPAGPIYLPGVGVRKWNGKDGFE